MQLASRTQSSSLCHCPWLHCAGAPEEDFAGSSLLLAVASYHSSSTALLQFYSKLLQYDTAELTADWDPGPSLARLRMCDTVQVQHGSSALYGSTAALNLCEGYRRECWSNGGLHSVDVELVVQVFD